MKMAGALKGISVLIIEDDDDTRDLYALSLGATGAVVKTAATAEAALAVLETWRPDVVLCDLQLPGVDGYSFVELLRANPHLRDIPAIAISGSHPTVAQPRALQAGFEKHLTKPSKLPDIVLAVASAAARVEDAAETAPEPATPELRSVLAKLNAATPCRYTSLLRVDADDTLVSIWTYDRERPRTDPFPLGLPVHVSYCVLVRELRTLVAIEDATTDARVRHHPDRAELACYVGAPLFRRNGTLFGTVCSYDPSPQVLDAATRTAIERSARALQPWLWDLFPDP